MYMSYVYMSYKKFVYMHIRRYLALPPPSIFSCLCLYSAPLPPPHPTPPFSPASAGPLPGFPRMYEEGSRV